MSIRFHSFKCLFLLLLTFSSIFLGSEQFGTGSADLPPSLHKSKVVSTCMCIVLYMNFSQYAGRLIGYGKNKKNMRKNVLIMR